MDKIRNAHHIDTDLMRYRLGWLVVIGFGLIVIGLTAIYAPYYSGFTLQSIIGSSFLISGAMFMADAYKSRQEGRFVPESLMAILYIVFAILVGFAAREAKTITVFSGIFLFLEGILKIFYSVKLYPKLDWRWALMSGVLSLIIGAVLWWIPYGSPLVGVMAGLDLTHTGLATIMIAHAMRETLEKRELLCIGDLCFSE